MFLLAEVCKLPFASRSSTPVPNNNFQYLHFSVASKCSGGLSGETSSPLVLRRNASCHPPSIRGTASRHAANNRVCLRVFLPLTNSGPHQLQPTGTLRGPSSATRLLMLLRSQAPVCTRPPVSQPAPDGPPEMDELSQDSLTSSFPISTGATCWFG